MEDHKTIADLPSPEDLVISSYEEAHNNPKGGVYVAEIFSSDYLQSEVFLGDDQISNYNDSACLQCLSYNLQNVGPKLSAVKTDAGAGNNSNKIPSVAVKETPNSIENIELTSESIQVTTEKNVNSLSHEFIMPYDGPLDLNSNYTGFIEIVGE